jgi:hypothetical protein
VNLNNCHRFWTVSCSLSRFRMMSGVPSNRRRRTTPYIVSIITGATLLCSRSCESSECYDQSSSRVDLYAIHDNNVFQVDILVE